MNVCPPAAASADTVPGDPAQDRAGGCACCAGDLGPDPAAQHMKLLASLSEVGVELAQMAGKQAREANWLGADGAVMYERIALAVRRTIALHTRLYAEARARQDRGAAEQARRAAMAREDARRRKEQVRHEVDAAIEAAGRRPDADPRETERLLRDLTERLDDPET